MMRNHVALFLMITLLALLAACGGNGGPVTPPDDFTRLTATVQGTDGAPLADLTVRVEGRDTGVRSNAAGQFTLERSAFPRGVNAPNEISLGRNGIVLGNGEVTPVSTPDITLKFGDNFGLTNPDGPGVPPVPTGDPGSLAGNIYDETTGGLLDGVEITVFSPHGDLLMTTSDNGRYQFDSLSPGDWNLTAFKDGYQPESAAVQVPEGAAIVQHLSMVPKGQVSPGDGLLVTGTVLDSDSGAPVANAVVSVMVDTGYMGMPEPAIYDDMEDWGAANVGTATSPGSAPTPGVDSSEGDARDSSMMPWFYEPQYFEVTTGADGTFALDEEVIGYSLWFDVRAENYLNGSQYEYIEGETGTLDVTIEIDPFVPTTVSGQVVDDLGAPIEGAYVEFIFAGDNSDMYYAMPGVLEMDGMATDAMRNFEENSSPPPPMAPTSSNDSGGWDEWADAAPAMEGGAGSNQGGSGGGVDNPSMMRFRWENSNASGHGTSDAEYFTGFYSTNADADGNYSFEGIPAGTYYVFASAYRHLPFNDVVEALETANDGIDIVLPNQPVGTVTGVIRDDNGVIVPDCLVNATQPNVDPFTYTDATGHYTIENVPVGTWTISAYKQGYLTRSQEVDITENGMATINLMIDNYDPPVYNVIAYTGHVVNGADNAGISGCDIVFTPVNEEDGSYYQHVQSGANGAYSAALISSEYNVLIQREGYEDIFMRIWVDAQYPSMDFWMWKINSGNGGGWGGGPVPMMDFADAPMPERGMQE